MAIKYLKIPVLLFSFLILFSCTPKKPVDTRLSGSRMMSQVKETWGSGCGRNCTFNSDGSYNATLVFGESDDVILRTTGQSIHVIHYPDSFILDAKKSGYDYEGSWQDVGEDVQLDLKLLRSECTLQRSEGKKKTKLPCEKVSKTKVLICANSETPVDSSMKQVFTCQDEDENEIVFGIGETITKILIGEPSIKTYFYTEAKTNENAEKTSN